MIKVYNIKVGNKTYQVEVESVSEKEGSITPTPTKEKKEIKNESVGEGISINSPMQGVILDIKYNSGDSIKKGDTLVILEAMKMENPILSPVDGTISKIFVNKGDTVENNKLIMTIEEN